MTINLNNLNAQIQQTATETRTYSVNFHRDDSFWWDDGFVSIQGAIWKDWTRGAANLGCSVKLDRGRFNKIKPGSCVQDAFDLVLKAIGKENLKAGLSFTMKVSRSGTPEITNLEYKDVKKSNKAVNVDSDEAKVTAAELLN